MWVGGEASFITLIQITAFFVKLRAKWAAFIKGCCFLGFTGNGEDNVRAFVKKKKVIISFDREIERCYICGCFTAVEQVGDFIFWIFLSPSLVTNIDCVVFCQS